MEELKKKQISALKALERLQQDIALLRSTNPVVHEFYIQFRSSAIQSFECSIDTLWKFLKDYLAKIEGLQLNTPTPRSVFKEAWAIQLMNEEDFNSMSILIADRNLTSHSYNESTAEEIVQKLDEHYLLMKKIVDAICSSKKM